MSQAYDDETYRTALVPLLDLIDLAGCHAMSRDVRTKQKLIDSLCHFYVVARVAVAIDQYVLRWLAVIK